MYHIQVPEPVSLFDITDKPLVEDGSPVVLSLHQFLLGRIADEAFSSGLNGLEAAEMALNTKTDIDRQFADGSCPIVLNIEDAPYKHLVSATRSPKTPYHPALQHCFVPLLHAVLNAKRDSE